MNRRTRLVVLLVSTPLVAFAIIGGLMGRASAREDDTYKHLRVFEDVVSLITSNYVEQVDVDRVMEGAMQGLADGLDPESAYLTPAQVVEIVRGVAAPAGTGVTLTRQFYLRVLAGGDGSPAARAGLRAGDYVRAIDGRSTRTMSVVDGRQALNGPEGSKVTVTVLRGSAAEPQDFVIERASLPTESVTQRVVRDGVGYLRIAAFTASTAGEVVAALRTLQEGGAASVVIDLRGTSDGSVESAVAVARLFVSKGVLVQREERDKATEKTEAGDGDGRVTVPVTLLCTVGTSGPAEVFAAALVDNGRADLVGERTFGRAAEQSLVRLPDGSGLWLTTGRYLMPSGKAISGNGLEPTVAVEEPDAEADAEPAATDPILDKAVERLATRKAA
jgi:carboxyl-terminal processing protease